MAVAVAFNIFQQLYQRSLIIHDRFRYNQYMIVRPDTINCPQCGNELPITFRYTKLTVCPYCNSTLFLEDDAVRLAGEQSVLTDMPSLLQLGGSFQYRTTAFTPIGLIRYSHTVGYWEEWWVTDNTGRSFWVSVDEGDFSFEKPIDIQQKNEIPALADLAPGKHISLWDSNWQVTEIGSGKCEGYKGELPKIIHIGDEVPFAHLSATNGQLITLEYLEDQIDVFRGEWIDPFEIKVISG